MFRRQKKTTQLPSSPQVYPTGICLKTEKGTYSLLKDGKRYRVQSQEIEKSWSFPLVVKTTEVACKNYPVAISKLPFRDGTLLYNIADGKMYLVSEAKLRHIVGVGVLVRLGVSFNDAMTVSQSDINLMRMGEAIT